MSCGSVGTVDASGEAGGHTAGTPLSSGSDLQGGPLKGIRSDSLQKSHDSSRLALYNLGKQWPEWQETTCFLAEQGGEGSCGCISCTMTANEL